MRPPVTASVARLSQFLVEVFDLVGGVDDAVSVGEVDDHHAGVDVSGDVSGEVVAAGDAYTIPTLEVHGHDSTAVREVSVVLVNVARAQSGSHSGTVLCSTTEGLDHLPGGCRGGG